EGAVHPHHLAEGAVHPHHLAEGAVQQHHLAEGAVHPQHLAEGAVHPHHLAEGSVHPQHLAEGAVHPHHLAVESVQQHHIAPHAVSGSHIQAQSIERDHLASGVISVEHLDEELFLMLSETWDSKISEQPLIGSADITPGVITTEHCAFTPIRASSTHTAALQQFGTVPFSFRDLDEMIELRISFDEPYQNKNYVLVAMTNHSACYAVMKSQSTDHAIIEIMRTRISPHPNGLVSWIAIG
ncbi:WIAG-tail domain, partial [Paenibacillus alvei]|uniref:WIAG-tail domain n=1 Tax=Paenibacillus alvei TaxID=44250 RepID=UPI002283B51A